MSKVYSWEVGMRFPTKMGGTLEVLSFEGGLHCSVVCSICHQDTQLFPSPLIVNKYKMKNGQQVCACGKTYYWTEDQYRVKITRICDEEGYKFNGWNGEFKGCETYMILGCSQGHIYKTTIENFLDKRRKRCPKCASVANRQRFKRSDHDVDCILGQKLSDDVHSFVAWSDGQYQNSSSKIIYHCKNKNADVEVTFASLLYPSKGFRCCGGNGGFDPNKNGIFYISFWEDYENQLCFYKYGISNKEVFERFSSQSSKTNATGDIVGYIDFDSGYDAMVLEDWVFERYSHSRVEKQNFADGYTETIRYNFGVTEHEVLLDIYLLTGCSFMYCEDHYPVVEATSGDIDFRGSYKYVHVGRNKI